MSWTELSDVLARYLVGGGGRCEELACDGEAAVSKVQRLLSLAHADGLRHGDVVLPPREVIRRQSGEPKDSRASGLDVLSGDEEEVVAGLNRFLARWKHYAVVGRKAAGPGRTCLSLDRGILVGEVLRSRIDPAQGPRRVLEDVNFAFVSAEAARRVDGGQMSQLSLLRAELVRESLEKVARAVCSPSGKRRVTVTVGCFDEKDLARSGDSAALRCKVGMVTSPSAAKKDRARGLLDVYWETFGASLESLGDRPGLGGSGTGDRDGRCLDAHRMASGCLRLRLLSGATSKPCQMAAGSTSALMEDSIFILYNYARLVQIARAYDENPSYPDLPPLDQSQLSLLCSSPSPSHALEWSLVLHLFRFEEVLASAVRDYERQRFHLHRLPRYLSTLSRDVSRYYRSVRVLLEPVQHLLPLVAARVHLVRAVTRTYEETFRILGVVPIPYL